MRLVLLTLVLVLAACAPRARSPLAVGYLPDANGAGSSTRRTALVDVTTLWRLPPLERVALPAGSRELRIADWYSMLAGEPVPVLRLVEDQQGARGEILRVWDERRDWPRHRAADRCTPWRQDWRTGGSVVALPDSVATRAAVTFERLGAWRIAERCENEWHVTDNGALLLERLVGDRLERCECNAPARRQGTEVGRRAAQLYDVFRSLVREGEAARPSR